MTGDDKGTKKKPKVSVDQFEDADEEDEEEEEEAEEVPSSEEMPSSEAKDGADPPKEEEAVPAVEDAPEVKTKEEKDDSKEKKEDDAETKEKEKKTTKKKSKKEDLSSSASSSPTPNPKGGDNPLDALAALACVAEEKRKPKKKKQKETEAPKPPKEGTRVGAENISCTDVLCGRGGQSNHHPGNIFFRRLVRAKQEEYLKANKREKTVVAKDIVKLIRLLKPPGRFLKKDPKDESVYVDVGDVQARNKASQALREGAPELREELRDQHSRLIAQNGGGPEVKIPYHGNRSSTAGVEGRKGEELAGMSQKERQMLAARAAAAQGMMLPGMPRFPPGAEAMAMAAGLRGQAGPSAEAMAMAAGLRGHAGPGAEAMAIAAGLRGQADPPDGSDEETEGGRSRAAAVSAAAMHAAAAEERARRLMMAGGPPPGLGAAHLFNPHLGALGGLGAAASMHPFLAGHSPAAAAQLQAAAAMQAAGGHMLSPQAQMMMAAAAGQPSAHAMLQASRARELANIEAANYAATAGMNPLYLGAHARAAQAQEAMRMHELSMMNAAGNMGGKRDREEMERDIEESYAKAAKMSRQY